MESNEFDLGDDGDGASNRGLFDIRTRARARIFSKSKRGEARLKETIGQCHPLSPRSPAGKQAPRLFLFSSLLALCL